MIGRSGWRVALAAAFVLVAAGGRPAPGAAEDPLALALAEQSERAREHPDDPRVHNDLGNLMALVGDTAGADAAYRRAIELDPDGATAHYNLGRLLAAAGQRRAARRELRRAVELDPANAAARYHLGALYDAGHRPRAARRWYRRAFELDPTLADPAKNPHVVGNRQALAALLMTWSEERVPGPTRHYEQPQRVVAVVTPTADTPPAASEGTQPVEAAEESAPATEGGGFVRLTSPAPPAADHGAPTPASDEPIEIDRESIRRPREAARPTDTDPAPGGVVLDAGTLGRRGAINQVVGPGSGADAGRPQPGRRPPMFEPPRNFVPGRDSTGRIEHRLEPADPARSALG